MTFQSWDKTIKILTIIICIYPIFPLSLVNIYGLTMFITQLLENRMGKPILQVALFFWFLGIPVAFIMLIRALFQKISNLDFWLLIYGGICYSSLVVTTVVAGISSPLPLNIGMLYNISINSIIIKILYLSYWLISIAPFIWYVRANYKAKQSLKVELEGLHN